MFSCPHGHGELGRQNVPAGVFWDCATCRGRAIGFGLLRQVSDSRYFRVAWHSVLEGTATSGCACPVCTRAMATVAAEVDGISPTFNICRRCEFIWFDPGQFELLPPPLPRTPRLGEIDETALPQKAREALALERVDQLAKQARAEDGAAESAWQAVPAALGLPIEMDPDPLQRRPWATGLTCAAIAAVSVPLLLHDLRDPVQKFGLIPNDPWREHGLTLLSSFFVHASVWHLAGNLYFLAVFGRHVENYLGSVRWFLVLLAATLAGDAFLILMTPSSSIPCIGASGGISGLLGFYVLRFPHARLGLLFSYQFQFRWLQFPAWSALLVWVGLQFYGAYQEITGVGEVASLAHLGGLLAGVVAWFAWRNLDAPKTSAAPVSPLVIIKK
jgi:membrane associated rhomboid family serine protease